MTSASTPIEANAKVLNNSKESSVNVFVFNTVKRFYHTDETNDGTFGNLNLKTFSGMSVRPVEKASIAVPS